VPPEISRLLMRWLPRLVVLVLRRDQAKDAGILILRHENAVLRPRRCWTGRAEARH